MIPLILKRMKSKLTIIQREVFLARCRGCTIKEIGYVRGTSPKTVENHWYKACKNLKIIGIEKAIHYALFNELIDNIYE